MESNLGDVTRSHPLYCEECERKVPQDEWLTKTQTGWYFMPGHATTVMQDTPRMPDIPPEAHRVWSKRDELDADRAGNKKVRMTVYFHFPDEDDDE